jgi:hypothetical protein
MAVGARARAAGPQQARPVRPAGGNFTAHYVLMGTRRSCSSFPLHSLHRMCTPPAFAGHQYLEYEQQRCLRNPGARGYGRENSTLTPEPGLRQHSIGPTSWRPLLLGGGPNVRWQEWSGSAMPPFAVRTLACSHCSGTAYTVLIKPTICPADAAGCM